MKEYPVRFNCMKCHALIKGIYNISLPGEKGLTLFNAEIEECNVELETESILNVDYVVEISGELPCEKVSTFNWKIIKTTPFIKATDQVDMIERINRLSYFVKNMTEWRAWRSIAFQLFNEGSTDYVPNVLKNMMGKYTYKCDNYLKALHCLLEIVQEEKRNLFYPKNEEDFITRLLKNIDGRATALYGSSPFEFK